MCTVRGDHLKQIVCFMLYLNLHDKRKDLKKLERLVWELIVIVFSFEMIQPEIETDSAQ